MLMTTSYVRGQESSNRDLRKRDYGTNTASRLLPKKGDTANNADGGGLVENHDCQAFSTISSHIMDHVNTPGECKDNSCGGGCCRVFNWLACDTSNGFAHLPCVCNENTATASPTVVPITLAPTLSARPTVSMSPTESPTESSRSPTRIPSETPSNRPSSTPSKTPSAMPSSIPSFSPSATPSQSPTITPYTTRKSDTAGVWVSTCREDVPIRSFLEEESFSYSFEVYCNASVVTDPANTVKTYLNDQIHDSLSKAFLKCQFDDAIDDIQQIMSQNHVIDDTKECQGALQSGERCFVVDASVTVHVYNAPKRRKLLDFDLVSIMTTFLFNTLNSAMYRPDVSGINAIAFINDGSSASSPFPSSAPQETIAGGDGNALTGNELRSTGGGGGISTAGVAIVSVACGALFAVFLMTVLSRRNKRKESPNDYLEDADLDMAHKVTALELHVDLDSMQGEIQMDPYTSPTSRSPSAPLTSQDELDRIVVGDHRGFRHSSRRYKASDIVDL